MSDSHFPLNGQKASTNYLQKIADLSPNLLFVIDLRERKIIYVNNTVKELIGLDAEEVYGQGEGIFKAIVHPDDYERCLENREKCKHLGDTEESEVEVRFRIRNGDWQWVRITEKVFERDEDGRVLQLVGTAQNIQEQWQEKLREEHPRFKNAQAIGHIGSFERELPGNIVYYSPQFYRILGLEPKQEKISLEEFMSHVHPEDREAYQAAIDHTHATGEPLDMVNRIICPDGSIKHVHRRAGIIRNEKGIPVRVYGTAQDITERVKAEEERKKAERIMRSTETVAGTGSYELDLRSNKPYFSEGLYRLFGEEPGAFVPTQDWLDERTHPEDIPEVRRTLDKAVANKIPYTYTRRIFRKDGETRILEAQGNVITDEEGMAVQLLGLVQDITERKRSQETIRQMLNGSISAITILESVRDRQGNIIDFIFKGGNKAAELLNGISTEELIGKKLLELFPGVQEVFFDTYVKVVEKGEPLRTQQIYKHENYDHWFDVSAVKNGDGLIMTYHDITEQKKAEQELLQLKDELAKRANESEYRFASLVTASSDTVYKMSADWKTMYHLQGRDFLSDTGNANNSWLKDYIPKPERPKVIRAIQDSIQTKKIFELEHQVFDINGTVGWTYSRAIPNLNKKGEIVEWLGVASNITARKKAEKRQSFLLNLSDALRSLREPEKIMDIAMKNLGKHMGVNRAYYSEALADGNILFTRPGYLNDVSPLPEQVKIADLNAMIRKMYLEGRNLVLNDLLKDLEPNSSVEKEVKDREIRACIGVPLVKDRKLLAVVGVHQIKPRQWMPEDIALVEEVCERTWAAVQRARAEKAMREAQESLSIAVEAARMGTWILDFTSSTSQRNFRHDQIFGYNDPQPEWNQEIARKHVLQEDQATFDAAFARAFKTGKLELEVRIRWQDGSIHWIAVNGHFYFDENGKPFRGAGVNFEITERRQAEQALRESEQRFRNLVEASALAVWETDPEGVVVVDSPSWRAFTGQTFEEWKGTGWMDAVHPDDRQIAARIWKEAVPIRNNVDMEYRLRSAAGDYRWTNVRAIPIVDVDGTILRWSGMNLDIHDRKQAEEALLKAKEEAEAAYKTKEDFVSTMSHEIRTPLNAVIGITNLLLEQKPREDQKENLNSLSFSAKNLLTLINDILDFSKLEAGKTELAENVSDLPDLLLSLKQAHQSEASAKGIQLHLNLGKSIPQYVSTDQLKLSQILHNLVSNAVKFTPKGQVRISVESNRQEEDVLWLDFTIQDSGIGISDDKVEHIFEKFAQAESSTVRHYGGTGLGLSITRLLLELMGSEIKVKSKPGEGSTFYFSLPIKIAGNKILAEAQTETPEHTGDLRHIRLLLVEDVEINRKIILQFLQNWWQVQPDEAINGKEAVEMAKTGNYDLILMDVRMPVMDGYEATRQIRKLPGYENSPILALTADKNQEVQQALHATQFTDLLTKPFEPGDLKQRIMQHLSASGKNLKETEESKAEPRQVNINHEEDPAELKEFFHLGLQHLQDSKKSFLEALAERDQEKLFHLEQKVSLVNKNLGFEGLANTLKKALMLLAEKVGEDRLAEISAIGKNLFDNAIKELQEKLAEPPFEISRYKKIAGENVVILQKLIGNSVRAFDTYRKEFIAAANDGKTESFSDLVHKNTTSIHYIQANRLAGEIEEYRELLKDPAVEKERLKEKKTAVLQEFEKIITGLKALED